MASRILHGRRRGENRAIANQPISIIPEGVDPRQVTVLQPSDWKRIHNSLTRYNEEAERLQALKEKREMLQQKSKEMVKNWDNTIEGTRKKKLQARQLREEKEEEERKKIDVEEAKYQAQKRKEAIERAKTLQYYQTDRVKTFHGALLLTEVLKERDAQVAFKASQQDSEKVRDEHLLRLQKRQMEEGILEDQKKALRRYNERKAVSDFQQLQVKDHIEEAKKLKSLDTEEGQNIKQQVEMYESAKRAIEEQRRKDKMALMEDHKNHMKSIKAREEDEQRMVEQEEEEIRQFAGAKKKMAKMRKEKETELFDAFQAHTERMRQKLANQMQQKVDDEDERIAKALAERERKREAEEQAKQEADMKEKKAIHQHRNDMMKEKDKKAAEEAEKNRQVLRQRVESDKLFHAKQEEKRTEQLAECKNLKTFQSEQIVTRKQRVVKERKEELQVDKKNELLLEEEERQFQQYATKVIQEAKGRGRNPYPLEKAAQEGPGGGRGPKFDGKNGLRPSYRTCDSYGVQLPNYNNATVSGTHTRIYGQPGESRKRLGFTW